ncbi:ubiquitin carboxyl-terminal hydrolase 19-like protein [Dinothrombium tinctorium]|uniref:Ubiquitin carboxyl-terminal hydrolase n=1 Tax=Dinothrombium tinctorium TaxID=1965070 RepID=A0A443R713_9ACAR|nr:ubiquitin carboxyl-terminal hydrolase 19-like protein [Dinothrombium tinctorium]
MVKKECFEVFDENSAENDEDDDRINDDLMNVELGDNLFDCTRNKCSRFNGIGDHSIGKIDTDSQSSSGDEEIDGDHFIVLEYKDVKFDYYEKGVDDLTVCLYVKGSFKESLIVDFEEAAFTVKFQTSDSKFFSNFENANETTWFTWRVDLKHAIKPEECSYKSHPTKIEIYLKKKLPSKWDQVAIIKPKKINNTPKPAIFTVEGTALSNNVQNTSKMPVNIWIPSNENHSSPPAPPPFPPPSFSLKPQKVFTELNDPHSHDSLALNRVIPSGNGALHPTIGYTGLENLGNTCFMNSVIQCLSNTEELRDYFMSNHFKEDINEKNPLGTGGNMAISFAVLLKHLWSGQHYSYSPMKLKLLMGEKISQFSGFAQHDAQEYMAYLLDSLHEDVNRIKNKPYFANSISSDSDTQIPDEELADEFWRKYRMRNDSIIVDLFQGQYKSKLVCPKCFKVSITFDPFLYLSIPIPKNQILHSVFFFPLDASKKPVRFLVKLHSDSKVKKLLEAISLRTGVAIDKLQMIHASDGNLQSYLTPDSSIPLLPKTDCSDMLLIFERLTEKEVNEKVCEFVVQQRLKVPHQTNKCSYCKRSPEVGKLRRCTQCYRSSYCNQICQKKDWSEHKKTCLYKPEPVGCPFIITLPHSECTLENLKRIASEYSRHSVDVFDPEIKSTNSDNGDEIDNGFFENDTLFQKRTFVLRNSLLDVTADSDDITIEQFLDTEIPETCYLLMEWLNNEKDSVIVESKDLDHSYDILEAERVHNEKFDINLEECLQMFTEPEILSPQEAWYCPRCKEHREASKQLSLWRLPQLLVIQLKRFSFKSLMFREKIDKLVKFPILGLDLSNYCCSNRLIQQRPLYDLYAVINHYGGMFGGHYTAFAKTSYQRRKLGWRLFDDSRVEDIDEENIVTRNAYILFYRLRESSE